MLIGEPNSYRTATYWYSNKYLEMATHFLVHFLSPIRSTTADFSISLNSYTTPCTHSLLLVCRIPHPEKTCCRLIFSSIPDQWLSTWDFTFCHLLSVSFPLRCVIQTHLLRCSWTATDFMAIKMSPDYWERAFLIGKRMLPLFTRYSNTSTVPYCVGIAVVTLYSYSCHLVGFSDCSLIIVFLL
jgi:hypothetical protein